LAAASTDSMRVLVVSSWFPYPLDNGSRLRIFHLLEALGREHDITLLSFGRDEGGEHVDPLLAFCREVHVVPSVEPRRLRLAGLFSTIPRYYAQTLSHEMLALIATHTPAHEVAMAMQIRAAVHLLHAQPALPTLFEEVEVGAARLPDAGAQAAPLWRRARHQLTWWKHRRFLRRLLDRADGATVVSSLERAQVEALGCPHLKISVVPNAVVVPGVAPMPRMRRRQIIYPGSVTFSANLDAVSYFVRDVWPGIRRRQPDLQFVVTGRTGDVDVSGLAAAAGVRFTGHVEDVDALIAESLACVVPLRSGGGTRLKVLQAMALGTPVVSTSKGIEGLDVQPDRHVLVGDTAEVLIRRTLDIVEDPALGERLAAAAFAQVRTHYTWDRSASLLAGHLERVAARG